MISRWYARLERYRRRTRLRAGGAIVGRGVQFSDHFWSGPVSGFECRGALLLLGGSKLIFGMHRGQPGRLVIGDGVYINHYAIIDCHHSITIGSRVLIGPHCYISDFDHGGAAGRPIADQPDGEAAPVNIGDGVWLGAGVLVLKGVTIGEGAVVGAGSVVTHEVAAGAIVAGCPARLLRMR